MQVRNLPHYSSPPRSYARQVRSGYTIVEVMMAVFVMAFALATSLTTLQRGFFALDNARSTTLAAQIMQSTMENLRLQNWSQVAAYDKEQKVDIGTIFGSQLPPAKEFSCVLQVEDAPSQIDMKQLTVVVTWKGLDERYHSLNSVSYYGKNGLYDYFYTAH